MEELSLLDNAFNGGRPDSAASDCSDLFAEQDAREQHFNSVLERASELSMRSKQYDAHSKLKAAHERAVALHKDAQDAGDPEATARAKRAAKSALGRSPLSRGMLRDVSEADKEAYRERVKLEEEERKREEEKRAQHSKRMSRDNAGQAIALLLGGMSKKKASGGFNPAKMAADKIKARAERYKPGKRPPPAVKTLSPRAARKLAESYRGHTAVTKMLEKISIENFYLRTGIEEGDLDPTDFGDDLKYVRIGSPPTAKDGGPSPEAAVMRTRGPKLLRRGAADGDSDDEDTAVVNVSMRNLKDIITANPGKSKKKGGTRKAKATEFYDPSRRDVDWYTPDQKYQAAKAEMYDLYRHGAILGYDEVTTPRRAHLMVIERHGLPPEPLGVVRRDEHSLNLSGFRIGDEYAEAIGSALVHAEGEFDLRQLNLRDNHLSPHGAAVILMNIRFENMVFLDLANNSIGSRGVQALCAAGTEPGLQHLNLEGNHLGDQAIIDLCTFIRKCSKLTRVILRNNNIGDHGVSALGKLLEWQAGHDPVESLLGIQEKRGGAAKPTLKAGRGAGQASRRSSAFGQPTTAGTMASASAMSLGSMGDTEFGGGLFSPVNSEAAPGSLSVDVTSAPGSSAPSVQPSPVPHRTPTHKKHQAPEIEVEKRGTLMEIDLAWNKIKGRGAWEFFFSLERNPYLRALDLSFNAVGSDIHEMGPDAVVRQLGAWLSSNKSLTHLDLSHNGFRHRHALLLNEALHDNHTLTGLHLAGNPIAVNAHGRVIIRPIQRASGVMEDEATALRKAKERMAQSVARRTADGSSPRAGGGSPTHHGESRPGTTRPGTRPGTNAGMARRGSNASTVMSPTGADGRRRSIARRGSNVSRVSHAGTPTAAEREKARPHAHGGRDVHNITVKPTAHDDDLMHSMEAAAGNTNHRIITSLGADAGAGSGAAARVGVGGHGLGGDGRVADEAQAPPASFPAEKCWICGQWRPFLFEWTAPTSGPIGVVVYLLTSFDDWEPEAMVPRADGGFELGRMVPNGRFQFMFRVDGVLRASMSEEFERLDDREPLDIIKEIAMSQGYEEGVTEEELLARAQHRAPGADPTSPSGSGTPLRRKPTASMKKRGLNRAAKGGGGRTRRMSLHALVDKDGYLAPGGVFVNYVDSEARELGRRERLTRMATVLRSAFGVKGLAEAVDVDQAVKKAATVFKTKAQVAISRKVSPDASAPASAAVSKPSSPSRPLRGTPPGGAGRGPLEPRAGSPLRTTSRQAESRGSDDSTGSVIRPASVRNIMRNALRSAGGSAETAAADGKKAASRPGSKPGSRGGITLTDAVERAESRHGFDMHAFLDNAKKVADELELMSPLLKRTAALRQTAALARKMPSDVVIVRAEPFVPTDQRKAWAFEDSVFASYQRDTPHMLHDGFDADWDRTKVANFVKDGADRAAAKMELRKNYQLIKNVFRRSAASTATTLSIFDMGWNGFTDFCNDFELLDSAFCRLKDIDTIFIATNVNLGEPLKAAEKKRNNQRSLTRFEFIEAMMRLAKAKYVNSGRCTRYAEAVKLLLEEHFIPNMSEYDDPESWRDERLYLEEVDLFYKQYENDLIAVYEANSGRYKVPGEDRFMSVEEWFDLLEKAGLLDDNVTDREAKVAYAMSMMMVPDEMETDSHTRMSLVEFYEALGRVAEIKEDDDLPLEQKLPAVFEPLVATLDADPVPLATDAARRPRGASDGT